MYHEETIIDGVLHWRGTPDGEWSPVSVASLQVKIQELKQRNDILEREYRAMRESVMTIMNMSEDALDGGDAWLRR